MCASCSCSSLPGSIAFSDIFSAMLYLLCSAIVYLLHKAIILYSALVYLFCEVTIHGTLQCHSIFYIRPSYCTGPQYICFVRSSYTELLPMCACCSCSNLSWSIAFLETCVCVCLCVCVCVCIPIYRYTYIPIYEKSAPQCLYGYTRSLT